MTRSRRLKPETNKLLAEDRPIHDWYRFVLSFPPHLVRDCLARLGVTAGQRVLDPFCGTGTTLVECKKLGISSVGVEANPLAHFASRVKVDWSPSPRALMEQALKTADQALKVLENDQVEDEPLPLFKKNANGISGVTPPALRSLPADREALLLAGSISPRPLHKTLVLLQCLEQNGSECQDHQLLALAKALITSIGNLEFGPEVGVGPAKADAAVVGAWLAEVQTMAQDLRRLHDRARTPAVAIRGDARRLRDVVEWGSIDAVITSPPYPNEKDYTRTTRLESVLLGFIQSKSELRALKNNLVRSNTRNVYKADDDDRWVAEHPEVQRLAAAIEARRLDLGKTSGFERMYHRVTKLYFGGMARHLAELRHVLRPGARLAYVVGDQASYLRVMIRTGQLLADIAQSLGYEVMAIDLFRTRLATATREQLREEVVLLRWPGNTPFQES